MKRFSFILFILMPALIFSQNQETKNESKSNAILFSERDGSLIKKELYPVTDIDKSAEIKEVAFTVILYSDLFTKEKIACLQINTSAYSSLTNKVEFAYGVLDADEVDKCYESLVYLRDNVITQTPTQFTDCAYTSRDFFKIGVGTNEKKEWRLFVRADNWKPQAKIMLKTDYLEKIILNLALAKDKIKEIAK